MKRITKGNAQALPVSHDTSIIKQAYLRKGEIPGILQWATATLVPGTSVTEHKHEDAREIFQVIEGSMNATINGKSFLFSEGDLLVIDPGELHSFRNDQNEPCKILYVLLRTD